MGNLVFNVVSFLAMFSPPFLLGYAWYRLLHREEAQLASRWRIILSWVSVALVSVLLGLFILAFLNYRCNADLGDWSCVTAWRNFAGVVIKSSPAAVLLAALGRKGTQTPTALAALAIAYDCVLVDMMA